MADNVTMASPRTPSARKAPATPTSSKSRSSKGASTNERKRKTKIAAAASRESPGRQQLGIKNETLSPEDATPGRQAIDAVPTKKPKLQHGNMSDGVHAPLSPFDNRHQNYQTMTDEQLVNSRQQGFSPPLQQQPSQPSSGTRQQQHSVFHELPQQQQQHDMPSQPSDRNSAQFNALSGMNQGVFNNLIGTIFQKNHPLFPHIKQNGITSAGIDKFAYALWNECLNSTNGHLLNAAATYSAMLNEQKLRALAILNYLPSWWFLREKFKQWLHKADVNIDDSTMEEIFKTAIEHINATGRKNRMEAQGGTPTTSAQPGDDAGSVQNLN